MSEEREGFLGRWSRLKTARQTGAEGAEPPTAVEAEAPAVPEHAVRTATRGDEDRISAGEEQPSPELPPIESLTKESDYSAFLKDGVPEEIKTLALRKLWRSDSVLANLDGLLEYGEDFSAPWRTNKTVATVYRVGKGMPGLLEKFVDAVEGDVQSDSDGEAKADNLFDSENRDTASATGPDDVESASQDEADEESTGNGPKGGSST